MARPSAGYITNRLCPANPAHGQTWTLENGEYCSHHDHDFPTLTQSMWSFDAYEKAKDNLPIARKEKK